MKVSGNGVGGVRPHRPTGGVERSEAPAAAEKAAGAEGAEGARATPSASSQALEELRAVVGAVPAGDPRAATMNLVRGLLRAELGAAAEKEPGFEKMASAVTEKIQSDPSLGEKLRKVLSELARP
jgi:hypothetical protein